MNGWDILLGLAVPTSALIGAIANGIWAKRGGQEAARVERSKLQAVDWQTYSAEIRQWTNDRLASMSRDIAARDDRIAALEEAVEQVQAEMDVLTRKYSAAIRYIRRVYTWMVDHLDPDDVQHPPDDIVPDL